MLGQGVYHAQEGDSVYCAERRKTMIEKNKREKNRLINMIMNDLEENKHDSSDFIDALVREALENRTMNELKRLACEEE